MTFTVSNTRVGILLFVVLACLCDASVDQCYLHISFECHQPCDLCTVQNTNTSDPTPGNQWCVSVGGCSCFQVPTESLCSSTGNCTWCGVGDVCVPSSSGLCALCYAPGCLGCDALPFSNTKFNDKGQCTTPTPTPAPTPAPTTPTSTTPAPLPSPTEGTPSPTGTQTPAPTTPTSTTPAPTPTPTQAANTTPAFVGILLAVFGNLGISWGLTLQKVVHNEQEQQEVKVSYTKLRKWWISFIFIVLGEIGNFLGYGWAAATQIAPLGAISVVSNTILARFYLQETLTRRMWAGCACAVLGATLVAIFGPGQGSEFTLTDLLHNLAQPLLICFIVLAVGGSAILVYVSARQRPRLLVDLGICGLLGSLTVICVKGVSASLATSFSTNNFSQLEDPLFYVLLVVMGGTLFFQIKHLNKAMQHFGAAEVVPVYYVLFSLGAIVGAIIAYHEYDFCAAKDEDSCAGHVVGFVLGLISTFTGVYLITKKKNNHHLDEALLTIGPKNRLESVSSQPDSHRFSLVPDHRDNYHRFVDDDQAQELATNSDLDSPYPALDDDDAAAAASFSSPQPTYDTNAARTPDTQPPTHGATTPEKTAAGASTRSVGSSSSSSSSHTHNSESWLQRGSSRTQEDEGDSV